MRSGLVLLAALGVGTAATPAEPPEDLRPRLELLRESGGVPALAAAVFDLEGPLAVGVVGVRALGEEVPAEIDDLWHIGSITKSFTSTLVALRVESGELDWATPVEELLPDLASESPHAGLTLERLLSHRGGLPANPAMGTMGRLRTSEASLVEQRREVAAEVLATAPLHPAGTAFLYSNAGFVIAGAMLEARFEEPWEEQLRRQVLEPMELRSAGFGAPGTSESFDQPRGHLGSKRDKLHPVPPGPFADNPRFLGPAGTLHMSIGDLAAWGREHLRGELGEGELLSAQTYAALHRARGEDYGLGWVDQRPEWAAGRRVVWHNGSNTMWYALVAFLPEAGVGFALASNGGIALGQSAVQAAVEALVLEWVPDAASAGAAGE
jgi:CubicO group peptidase (beta-lactamase class C family)